MERQELENSRKFKAAKELEHALNDYGCKVRKNPAKHLCLKKR